MNEKFAWKTRVNTEKIDGITKTYEEQIKMRWKAPGWMGKMFFFVYHENPSTSSSFKRNVFEWIKFNVNRTVA